LQVFSPTTPPFTNIFRSAFFRPHSLHWHNTHAVFDSVFFSFSSTTRRHILAPAPFFFQPFSPHPTFSFSQPCCHFLHQFFTILTTFTNPLCAPFTRPTPRPPTPFSSFNQHPTFSPFFLQTRSLLFPHYADNRIPYPIASFTFFPKVRLCNSIFASYCVPTPSPPEWKIAPTPEHRTSAPHHTHLFFLPFLRMTYLIFPHFSFTEISNTPGTPF